MMNCPYNHITPNTCLHCRMSDCTASANEPTTREETCAMQAGLPKALTASTHTHAGREKPSFHRVCEECGKEFIGIKLQKFCCRACAIKHNSRIQNHRKSERRKEYRRIHNDNGK